MGVGIVAITGYPGWVDKLKNGDAVNGTVDAYALVPMLYRSVNLRCDAISTVPFKLYRKDAEVEWPWKQSLAQLIKETERSLLLTGAAYWLKLYKGRVLTGFQSLNPLTMTVHYDASKAQPGNPWAGVTFTQNVQGATYGPWTMQEIVYFREPSLHDEVGPGLAPARVALQSAQLGHYLERFTSAFFEGGAQPITIMNLPESMDDAEFKRMTLETNSRFTGVVNAFRWMFVRSPDLKVTTLTPPINSLMLPELQERATTLVSMTLGVPRTMLEASAANYATADSDRQSFWRETVIPRLSLHQQVINAQLLEVLGYELHFTPESLDVMQTDEASRAGSLLQLVQAGVPLRGAMKILGYDQIEEALGPEPEPTPPTSPDATPNEPMPAMQDDAQVEQGELATPGAVASLRGKEWSLLAKKIERRIKSAKDPWCTFESDVISAEEVKSVMAHLWSGMTVHDVDEVIKAHKAIDDLTPDEKRIYNKIVRALEGQGEKWARMILRNEEVSPSLAEVLEPIFRTELQTTMQQRVDRLGTQFVPVDPADSAVVVQDWLANYVPGLIKEIDDTTLKIIQKAIEASRVTPGMTVQDIAAMVEPAVGKTRAAAIAITETTRAASQATVEYQGYLAQRGITMERVWNTDADDRVCPICGPLNGKTEDTWGNEFPGGPPAHVNCRCDTGLRVKRD